MNREKVVEYKMRDKMLLSIRDLMWQMKKLTEKFVKLYKIKKIISENVVKLELLVSIKIHSEINMSRIALYQEQVERQKKIPPPLVEINKEKKYEVEKILNKKDMRGKPIYFVMQIHWPGRRDI